MNVLSPRRGPCPSSRARLSRVSNALGDRARLATGRAAEVKKKQTHRYKRELGGAGEGYVDEIQDRQAKCKDGLGGGYQTEGGRRGGGGGGELRTERHQKSRRLRPVRLSLPESPSACLSFNLPASLRPDLIVSDWPIAVHETGPRVQLEWTSPPLISVVLGSASAFSTRTWQLKFTSSGSSISGWGPRREVKENF